MAVADAEERMDEMEATPMEEDEVLGVVRHSFECDLGICGGRQNVNHIHSRECRATTSEPDRIDSPSGSNDGTHHFSEQIVLVLRTQEDMFSQLMKQVTVTLNWMHVLVWMFEHVACNSASRESEPVSTCAEVCSRTDGSFEESDVCAAEASGRDDAAGLRSSGATAGEDDAVSVKKDHVELGRSFQMAVSVHDWALAESLVPLADPQRLNDGLCIALDSIWFLR